MVSGTLSWSLSSMAVAPSSCRFYGRNQKKAVRGDHRREMSLQHHVSEKHVGQDCVTHSVMFPFISCCLSRTKPQQAFRGSGFACAHVCVRICRHHLSHKAKAIQYSLCFFFSLQESWWVFGAGCRLISGQNRVKYLTRPRGRGETWASSRGKGRGSSWNCDFSRAAPALHLQVRPLLCETTQHAKPRLQATTPRDSMSSICLLDVDCSIVHAVALKRTLCGLRNTWIRVSTLKPGRPRPLPTHP